jgi:fatty acid desaturase
LLHERGVETSGYAGVNPDLGGGFKQIPSAEARRRSMDIPTEQDRNEEEALRETPRGAMALAGLTVFLLLVAWFSMYLFVFLPRGQVG